MAQTMHGPSQSLVDEWTAFKSLSFFCGNLVHDHVSTSQSRKEPRPVAPDAAAAAETTSAAGAAAGGAGALPLYLAF